MIRWSGTPTGLTIRVALALVIVAVLPVAFIYVFVSAITDDAVLRIDPADGSVRWRETHDTVSVGPFLAESGVIVAVDGKLVCHYP